MPRKSGGSALEWFEAEGFQPAVNPDFDGWGIRAVGAPELPTKDRPSGRVVFEVRDKPGLRVAIHISVETGEFVGVEIADSSILGGRSSGPPKPIRIAKGIRDLPFTELYQAARESLRWELATRSHSDSRKVRRSLGDGGKRLRESLAERVRPGQADGTMRPTPALLPNTSSSWARRARRLSHRRSSNYSPSRISNMIHEARRTGLLTEPPKPGTAGGELTSKAFDILDHLDTED